MLKLFLGAVCIGFAPIFVKLVSLGPTAIGLYRCAFAFFFIGILYRINRVSHGALPRTFESLAYVILAGLLFALDLFVWHRSVLYAGAGMGTILGNTQVFYVLLAGLFMGERVTSRFLVSVALAFVGVYLMVGFTNGAPPSEFYGRGILYGLATGMVYGAYLLSIRHLEKLGDGRASLFILTVVSLVSAFFLLLFTLIEGSLRLPIGKEWTWLILLALIAQVAGWLLISKALPRVPVSRAGLLLLTQPVVATILGNAIFAERLGSIQLIGAALTLTAIYLGGTSKRPLPVAVPRTT